VIGVFSVSVLQICAKFNASFSSLSYVVESERNYEHPGRELLNQHNKKKKRKKEQIA